MAGPRADSLSMAPISRRNRLLMKILPPIGLKSVDDRP
jgi:hypothetical protein